MLVPPGRSTVISSLAYPVCADNSNAAVSRPIVPFSFHTSLYALWAKVPAIQYALSPVAPTGYVRHYGQHAGIDRFGCLLPRVLYVYSMTGKT